MRLLVVVLLFCLSPFAGAGQVCVDDAHGKPFCLPEPAKRIAALSPGATELVWAAGAGEQVVAVVAFSDYPPEAREVTSVGSHTRMDLERLVALQPDLVIGWITGNPAEQLQTIAQLGIPVYLIEPLDFAQMATVIEQLAVLAGTEEQGQTEARRVREGIADLRARYAEAAPVSMFYQVWDQPLMTINGEHLISEAIEACGGVNVFADLGRLVPRIGDEAVLSADPEVIIAGGMGEENSDWLAHWRQYPGLQAVAKEQLFFVPPSLIQRPTPRMLDGTALLCAHLDTVRDRAR